MKFNKDIQDLSEAIAKLQIAQLQLDRVLTRIREQGNEDENNEETSREEHQESEEPFLLNSTIRRGDRVLIINPNRDQEDRGVAIGTNRAQTFIIVRTPNGSKIKRIPKNLRKY